MEPNLFRNRWLALAFVGVVLVMAIGLVGSEDDEGLLDRFMHEQDRDVEVVERLDYEPEPPPSSELLVTSSPEEVAGSPRPVGTFASDEELVDDAEGFATTPMIVHEGPSDDGAMLEADSETFIIDADERESEF